MDLTAHVFRFTERFGAGSGGGQARGILRAWRWWERFATLAWPAPPLAGAPYGLLRVRITRYHGPPVDLPDGTLVRSGDTVGEFHLNNQVLAEISRRNKWELIGAFSADMAVLADQARSGTIPADVRAFHGYTLLTRGALRVGFVPAPATTGPAAWFEQLYLAGLLQIYSLEGSRRVEIGKSPRELPRRVWMSRAVLAERFGQTSTVSSGQ